MLQPLLQAKQMAENKVFKLKDLIFIFLQSTRVSIDDSSYTRVRDPTKLVNGRQKTSISINSYNNHQIKPAMLSKARSRENIAASHGNLSIGSSNSLKGKFIFSIHI